MSIYDGDGSRTPQTLPEPDMTSWCAATSEVSGEDGPPEHLVCAKRAGHEGTHRWMVGGSDR